MPDHSGVKESQSENEIGADYHHEGGDVSEVKDRNSLAFDDQSSEGRKMSNRKIL